MSLRVPRRSGDLAHVKDGRIGMGCLAPAGFRGIFRVGTPRLALLHHVWLIDVVRLYANYVWSSQLELPALRNI